MSTESSKRLWSPIFGMGTLIFESNAPYPKDGTDADKARWEVASHWLTFTPEDGAPFRWQWREAHVGRKDGKEPRGKKASEEWDRWQTWGGYEFRDAPPEAKEEAQADLFASR